MIRIKLVRTMADIRLRSAFSYVANLYVFEFVCACEYILFTSSIFLESCIAMRTTISIHRTVYHC